MKVLTVENAKNVKSIRSIQNPEWGIKRFNYNEQPLGNNEFVSTFGVGTNSAIINEYDYKFWEVIEMNDIFSELDNIEIENGRNISEKLSKEIDFEIRKYDDRKKLIDNVMFQISKLDNIEFPLKEHDKYTPHNIIIENIESEYKKLSKFFNQHETSKKILVNQVIDKINAEYNLKLNIEIFDDKMFINNIAKKDTILNILLKDHIDLEKSMFDNIKDDFLKTVRTYHNWDCRNSEKLKDKEGYYKSDLKKNKISFGNYVYVRKDWNGNPELDYSFSTNMKPLSVALDYFFDKKENIKISLQYHINRINNRKMFEYTIPTYISLKIFNNGRVDLTFENKDYAEQFYLMFGLNEKYKN